MSFRITYRRLFTVNLLHEYFLNQGETAFDTLPEDDQNEILNGYNVLDFCSIQPTPKTKALLDGRGLVFRNEHTGFFVGARLDESVLKDDGTKHVAQIPLDDTIKFTFGVELTDPYFLNYTSLPLRQFGYRPFYFSNHADNAFFLSHPVPAYDTDRAYQPGDLHVDVQGAPSQIFEALRETGPGTRVDADWEVVGTPQSYVTYVDQIPLCPSLFSVDLSHVNPTSATLQIRSSLASPPILETTIQGGPTLSAFPVDLRELETGLYDLQIRSGSTIIRTDKSGPIYLDAALYQKRVFAVIEIHHNPAAVQPERNLINTVDQTLKKETYFLRFKNRRTFWRYIFNSDQAPGGLDEFERDPLPGSTQLEKRRFKTIAAKPLTQALLALNKFDTDELLPNPGVTLVLPERRDKQVYSEIFLP